MRGLHSLGLLIGRLCICAIFILAGIGKIMNWDATSQYMASKGMTMIPLFLALAIIIELLGGLLVLVGYRTRITAIILLLYLIPVTYLFHDFWHADAAAKELQTIEFLKNLAIFGGLVLLATSGAGLFSIDRDRCHHRQPQPIDK